MNSQVLQRHISQSTKKERLDYLKASIRFRWNSYSLSELQAYYQELLRLETAVTEEQQLQSSKELQAKYQFEKQELKTQSLEKENQFLRKEKMFEQWRLYSILAIGSLLGVILLLNLHRHRQRARSQSLRLQSQEQEIEFQKQRTNWAEKEKELRDQLIQQQKNLLSRALQEAEENKTQLEQVIRENEESKRKELLEQFEHSKQEKLGLDSLIIQFNSIHPTFTATLLRLYPALSQADIQFCTLFRMNLTTKEISILMNIEPRSIYQKKYRIMKKMGFGEDDNFERMMFEIA
jgi:hypothetical protein